MKRKSLSKGNMEKMKCKMKKAIRKGVIIMEMAEDTMNLFAKAKMLKNKPKKDKFNK